MQRQKFKSNIYISLAKACDIICFFLCTIKEIIMLNKHHFGFHALWLVLVLMSPLAQAATDCAAITQIPSTECEALVAFYDSTGGANWSHNDGWNETNMPCSWYGVSCSGGHVSGLDLSDNQLTGSIPTELGNLSNLTRLDLSGNQLTGSIPAELGNLSNLEELWLFYNQLTGTIPTELGNLSNLETLILSSNQLTGSIPTELGNLSNLEELYLSSNQITGSIPTELGNLSKLNWFDLSNNELTGSIPAELGNLSNLKEFWLFENQLIGSIPTELGNLSNLDTLILFSNQLTGSIPRELGNLTNLWALYLSNNQLTGEIPRELGNLMRLIDLMLDNNQLCGEIPVELKNLSNIFYLNLNNNHLIPPNVGTSDPELIAWLDEHNPDWETTQTPCPIATLQFESTIYYVIETGGQATFTVTRVGGDGAISANYATTDGTATAGSDYTQTTGTLTWADGDSADKTITITITDDGDFEGPETFTITLTDPISGESLDNATITIYDNYATFVTLADFTATANETGILLEWQTAIEIDNAGFHLWRATGEGWKSGDYSTVIRLTEQLIAAQGNSSLYTYRDTEVESGITYYYGLEDIDLNGQSTFHWDLIDSATARYDER
jgi:Leucine-rich repeat (LRR) protein